MQSSVLLPPPISSSSTLRAESQFDIRRRVIQELTILTGTTPQYKEDIDDTNPEFDTDDFAFVST